MSVSLRPYGELISPHNSIFFEITPFTNSSNNYFEEESYKECKLEEVNLSTFWQCSRIEVRDSQGKWQPVSKKVVESLFKAGFKSIHLNRFLNSNISLDKAVSLLPKEAGLTVNEKYRVIIQRDFEQETLKILNSRNFYYKKSSSGIHQSPILFDSRTNEPVAIFKEENTAYTSTRVGDLIAYQLDHESYAGVVPAYYTSKFIFNEKNPELNNTRGGVFVKWLKNLKCISLSEHEKANIEIAQAIVLLDIRLGNVDRDRNNRCNILVDKKNKWIPVDHDLIFRGYVSTHTSGCYFNYLKQSLTDKAKEYIRRIDINKDISVLRSLGVSSNQIIDFIARNVFLKIFADQSVEKTWNLEYIQCVIGRIYYNNNDIPLRDLKEPYDDQSLKEAFRPSFNRCVDDCKYIESPSYLVIMVDTIARPAFCLINKILEYFK